MRVGGLVGAVDMGGMEIEVFDYQSGEAVGSIGLSPGMRITSMTEVGDSVWIAGMDRDTWMSVGTVAATELPSLARTGSKESLRLDRIAIPSPYQTNPIMFGALGTRVSRRGGVRHRSWLLWARLTLLHVPYRRTD